MSKEQSKEYAECLKDGIKEFVDKIGTDDEYGQRIINLIYGFSRAGFLEYRAGKGGEK